MNGKEQFKKNIEEIAKQTIKDSFTNNLMETLNSAFIFKYVDTLEKQNTQLKSVLKEIREYMEVEEEAGTLWTVRSTNVILEIIDKGIKENDK